VTRPSSGTKRTSGRGKKRRASSPWTPSIPDVATAAGIAAGTLLGELGRLTGPSARAGLLALGLARRARQRLERSVRRAGAGIVRTGRWFAWSGLYLAATGALALGFYGLLRLRG
jgi:hypothetical protein